MSDEAIRCPECGAPARPGFPVVLCPCCLLRAGAGGGDDAAARATGSGEGEAGGGVEDAGADSGEMPGARIGRYVLVEAIGQGGFGTVWVAEQREPVRRLVALKILKLGMDTREVVARFEAERQALALMEHPNIARVFDGGATGQGRPYFVMELVKGVRITEYCDRGRLTTEERLRLLVDVCRAVQHAHQKGVIHRDLKPSNVLVTEREGSGEGAVVKVIDFGIAKAVEEKLTEETFYTRFNQVLGTPAYMSPEQAGLGSLDVDTRSDVYSLGVLLYELLVGRPPFSGEELRMAGLEELLRTIREKEPTRPSTRLGSLGPDELAMVASRRGVEPGRLGRLVRGELDWIVLKALEKDRSRRYESPAALAADLERYLGHEPVSAAAPGLGYQVAKFARRHRVALATASAFVLVLLVATVVSAWQAVRATRLARSETAERTRAERVQEEQRRLLYVSEMGVAFQAWDAGQAPRTRRLLEQQRPAPGAPDRRGWEWHHLRAISRPQELAVVEGIPGFVSALGWSRDGRQVVAGLSGGLLQVWDPARRVRLVERQLPEGIPDAVEHTPDGRSLYVSMRQPQFYLLDAQTLETRLVLTGHVQRVSSLGLDPSGRVLATSGGDYYGQRGPAELFVWDTATHAIRFKLPSTEAFCPAPRLSATGRYLGRGLNRDGRVEVWDLEERRQISVFTAHRALVFASAFSPDESQLATVGDDGFVRLWDWRQGRELSTLGRHAAPAVEVVFAPDGRRIVTCGLDSAVRVWDVATRSPQATLLGHMGRLHRVRLSPDGRTAVSGGGGDGTLRFWDAAARTEDTLLERQGQTRADLAFLRDSRTLAVVRPGDGGPTLRLWDLVPAQAGRERTMTREIPVTLAAVAPVGDGGLLAVGAGPAAVDLLEAGSGRAVRRLESPRALLRPLASSQDGAWLAGCTVSNQVVIWEVASGRVARDLNVRESLPPGAGPSEMSLAFSGDGRRLWLARSTREDVVAVDWEAGAAPRRLAGHERGVSVLARSADGALVASGSHDMTARLWDAGSLEPAGVLRGESGAVTALAFSPDGRTLAMGTFDGQVKLWNVGTRLEIATLRAHNSIVYGLAFAPDGSVLASASYDGTTRVWLAPRGE